MWMAQSAEVVLDAHDDNVEISDNVATGITDTYSVVDSILSNISFDQIASLASTEETGDM